MKKRLLACFIPACFMGNVAHAQSSVQLYGLLDEGLNFTNNSGGQHAFQTISGDLAASRWGMKGNEDLGGGLAAVFRLESGFSVNNGTSGQGGVLFGEEAYVGLSSKDYGTVTMGRQLDPTIDMWAGFTGAGNLIGDLAAHPFDNDNSDFDFRVQNAVKYVSPSWNGFKAEAMYGFSNEAGGFANNRLYSAAASYQIGGFSAALAYLKQASGGANTTGAVSTATQVFVAGSQQNIEAGASYTFSNNAMIAFAYSHVDVYDPVSNAYFSNQPALGSQNSWKFDNFDINGQWYFRPDFWLAADYTYSLQHVDTVSGNSTPKWQQVALMLDYDLSKQTSVYIQGAYQHVKSNTGQDFDNASIIGSAGTSSTGNQMLYRVAMIHKF
jgi:predicted porin